VRSMIFQILVDQLGEHEASKASLQRVSVMAPAVSRPRQARAPSSGPHWSPAPRKPSRPRWANAAARSCCAANADTYPSSMVESAAPHASPIPANLARASSRSSPPRHAHDLKEPGPVHRTHFGVLDDRHPSG
jgi:hypothetical protein